MVSLIGSARRPFQNVINHYTTWMELSILDAAIPTVDTRSRRRQVLLTATPLEELHGPYKVSALGLGLGLY